MPPPPAGPRAPAAPVPPPVGAADVDMIGVEDAVAPEEDDEDDDALFGGGDDEDEGMEEVVAPGAGPATNGVKRKLVEDDDYD